MFKEIRFGDELKRVCEEMYEGNEHLFPFSSYEYLALCRKCNWYHVRRWTEKHRFYLYESDDGQGRKILAPLSIKGGKAYFFVKKGYTDPNDVVYSANVTDDDFAVFWAELQKVLPAKFIQIFKLRDESLFYRFIEARLQKQIINKEDSICVKVDFGDDYAKYYAKLTAKGRTNTKVMYNRVKKSGMSMNFHVAELPCERAKNFELVVDCWRRLQETKYTRNFGGPWGRFRFLHCTPSVIGLKTMSSARMFWLELNGEIAAVETGFIANNHSFLVPRGAMNPKFRYYSSGRLLIDQIIRYFMENTDIRCLDLTNGDERYKFDVGGKPYWVHSYEIEV